MPSTNSSDHDLLIRIDETTKSMEGKLGRLCDTVKNNHKEFEDCKTHRGREIGKLHTEIAVVKEQPKVTKRMIIIGCTVLSVLIAGALLAVTLSQGGLIP
jgi:hypothetical protein